MATFTVVTGDPAAGSPVQFDASASDDSDGIIVSYEWDFDGDGAVDATGRSPVVAHTYDAVGTFEASLTVVDAFGFSNATSRPVQVARTSGTSGAGVNDGNGDGDGDQSGSDNGETLTPTPTPTPTPTASPTDEAVVTETQTTTPTPPATLFGVQFPWWLLLLLLLVALYLYYRYRTGQQRPRER